MKVKIKICGITSVPDGAIALSAGADYIGFVFHNKSPRNISPKAASAIIRALGAEKMAVGVFVNESHYAVAEIAEYCSLRFAQLHGDESAADFRTMPCDLWRAIKRNGKLWDPEPEKWKVERFLVDAAVPNKYGGTGTIADWTAAKELARSRRLMLAGGLTPENVADAVRTVQPAGVDVSSGVESSPGIKDHDRVREFIRNVKSA